MNSKDLARLGFSDWRGFSLSEEKRLLSSLPKKMGVYVIRDSSQFGRYHGKSDIVYIGSSTSSDGLRRRIRFYFHPGLTQHTSKRIREMLNQIQTLKIAWVQSAVPGQARALEKNLLGEYVNDHFELPPFNRQG
jgi:excinuclease UvrABC nuclease subunit